MPIASLSPAQVALLFTSVKAFSPGGLIGDPTWNERGLHAWRVELAYALNRRRRARSRRALSAELRGAFDRDGYVLVPDFLPPPVFAELCRQVQALKTDVRERAEGSTLLRKIPIDADVLAAVPALHMLRTDRRFCALMAYGEGNCKAPQLYIQAVTQRPNPRAPDPQCRLHRDTFHPTVKAWLYLKDVPEDAGPLVYVPGSHQLNPARLEWERHKSVLAARDPHQRQSSFRIEEHELRALGHGPPRPLPVAANSLIVADTFGFHARGTSQKPSMRLEIWATGHRSPFLSHGLDRAVQQLTGAAHRVMWRTRDSGVGLDLPE